MELMDELAEAYLDNSFEHRYYLDLETGQVIIDWDESYTGEPGIDWEDEANEERYADVPKITSDEAYYVRVQFAKQTESDPALKLFEALEGYKPFRRFKDVLYELDLWDEWNRFERQYANEQIRLWMERFEWSYDQMSSLYRASVLHHPE
jgi:hypothetical protein